MTEGDKGTAFAASADGGILAGWVVGDGPPVLLLHGGPGLRYDYMEPLIAELCTEFRVAIFQQRGLEPSTLEGPFTIAQAVEDVVCVLDALGWSVALVVGHSWGGHLAFRFAAAHSERLLGMLAVDALGIVGDGGRAAFVAELLGRAPRVGRERVLELEELEKARELTTAELLEMRRIIWPSYFADPEKAPPMPPFVSSRDAHMGLTAELGQGIDEVASALATGAVRYGVLAGGASPFPWGQAARPAAELSSSAFLKVVPGAGHFVWHEAPGAVRAELRRLTTSS
ncbi:MAG: alpha/beta fold hydrolase [Solirubrobacteraceae bacterium]